MGCWIRSLKSTGRGRRLELEDAEWELRRCLLKDTGEFTDAEIAELGVPRDPRESGIFDVTAERAERCADALIKRDSPDFLATLRFKDGPLEMMTRVEL